MKLLKSALLSFSFLVSLSSAPALAKPVDFSDLNTVAIAGRTNRGERLSYSPSSVKLYDYQRAFAYTITSQNGNTRFNVGVTPWCRHGKVQLDRRAIAGYAALGDNDYLKLINAPGWIVKKGESIALVEANSSASRNLLAAVCAE